jgi:hypothetical protein
MRPCLTWLGKAKAKARDLQLPCPLEVCFFFTEQESGAKAKAKQSKARRSAVLALPRPQGVLPVATPDSAKQKQEALPWPLFRFVLYPTGDGIPSSLGEDVPAPSHADSHQARPRPRWGGHRDRPRPRRRPPRQAAPGRPTQGG